ncbi:two-component system response regulator HsbR [Denitratisoma sp. agr-D3]
MLGPQASRLRILVVDDEEANLLFLDKALSRKGHQVILAHNGEEALSLFERMQPDLVLMDVMMPGWDGFETTRRIRAGGGSGSRWIPLIFLSAVGRTPDMVKGMASGGDDYLVKPVDLALLESKIAAMQRIALLQRDLETKNSALAQAHASSEHQKQTSVKIFSRLMRLENMPLRHIQFRVLPCDAFSGDLVGAAEGPDGSIYLLLADAAGHGLDAAATVLPLISHFYTLSERGHPLAHIAREMNQRLHELLPTQHFVAAQLLRADPARGLLEVLNAGMPSAYLLNADGSLRREFRSNYLPFGLQLLEQEEYQPEMNFVCPGQQVLLCSDGLTESGTENNNPFGIDGVLAAVNSAHAAESRMGAVLAAYERHRAGREAEDDVSIAVLTIPEWPAAQLVGYAPALSSPPEQAEPGAFSLRLGPDHVRNPNLVANLVQMLSNSRLIPPSLIRPIFFSMKELLANAVDYGLLKLDSRAPACSSEESWQTWRTERRQRLADLDQGYVVIDVETLAASQAITHARWRLTVGDSGDGFNTQRVQTIQGGLARIQRLTGSQPVFNEQGNVVAVEFP